MLIRDIIGSVVEMVRKKYSNWVTEWTEATDAKTGKKLGWGGESRVYYPGKGKRVR
jgi:hypothetical protein